MIYDGLEPGGALIFVEKILSESMDDLMVELYYEMKRENGYTEEQIAANQGRVECGPAADRRFPKGGYVLALPQLLRLDSC